MNNISFYLFIYHIVISGILTYNEFLGYVPVIPFRTLLLFGLPFILYAIVSISRFLLYRFKLMVIFRVVLFSLAMFYLAGYIFWKHLDGLSVEITSYNLVVLSWYSISFIIGAHLNLKPSYRPIIVAGYAFMVINVLFNINYDLGRIHITSNEQGIFHFLGDSFAIWSLLIISYYRNDIRVLFIILLSLLCLYFIASRSSMYAFIFVIPFIVKQNRNSILRFSFFLVFVAGLFVLLFNLEAIGTSRMFRFLFTGSDHSFYLRTVIIQENFNDLLDNWVYGDYAGQLRHGVFGHYIHNYLSLWRQFGIVPFLIFAILLLPFLRWFLLWFFGKRYQKHDFLFYLVLFSLVEIIFTRSYKFHFIWFALGMMTYIRQHDRKKEKSIPGK